MSDRATINHVLRAVAFSEECAAARAANACNKNYIVQLYAAWKALPRFREHIEAAMGAYVKSAGHARAGDQS